MSSGTLSPGVLSLATPRPSGQQPGYGSASHRSLPLKPERPRQRQRSGSWPLSSKSEHPLLSSLLLTSLMGPPPCPALIRATPGHFTFLILPGPQDHSCYSFTHSFQKPSLRALRPETLGSMEETEIRPKAPDLSAQSDGRGRGAPVVLTSAVAQVFAGTWARQKEALPRPGEPESLSLGGHSALTLEGEACRRQVGVWRAFAGAGAHARAERPGAMGWLILRVNLTGPRLLTRGQTLFWACLRGRFWMSLTLGLMD